MEPVVVTIAHSLGKDEVLRRLRLALGDASRSFPAIKIVREEWTGDQMDFEVKALGQGVAGNVQVADDSVRIEVMLPWLLAKLAGRLPEVISQRGRVLLERK